MQNQTVATAGERALIERIRARLSTPPWVVVGPGDDAAVIEPERGTFDVVTTDALVEGVHFDRRFVPPDAIGHRAMAVNLSDLAAMGAQPRAALLSLLLPDSLDVASLDRILDGLLSQADAHRVTLVGGNITRSPGPLVLDVTAIGSVRPRRILRRTGARPGDDIYVTGVLGEAAAGLRLLQASTRPLDTASNPVSGIGNHDTVPDACRQRYLYPAPRVRAGVLLGRSRAASSCMDLSDGLADAARQVADASSVGILIDEEALPISAAVRQFCQQSGHEAVDMAVSGGDDYELMFTVRPAQRGRLRTVRQQVRDLPMTRIGVVTRERSVLLKSASRTRPFPSGFEHFR